MRDLIISLFGEYQPLTEIVTRTYTYGNGETSSTTIEQTIAGVAGIDFVYVSEVLLFAIVLISFFKIVGALIKCKT